MLDTPPKLDRILETVLYCRDETREAMNKFYDEVLGLRENRISGGSYRLGNGVLLLFNADKCENQSSPPPHGTSGRGHICFVAPDSAYETWQGWIRQAGIGIIEEIEWQPPVSSDSGNDALARRLGGMSKQELEMAEEFGF